MSELSQPIGILGGTFDPIHFGHLRTALELQQELHFAEVRLVPCYQPVHRKQPMASPEHRLAMARLAVESEALLQVDACEIERKGPSYTIDTLITLREALPHTPLCLIMGIDSLLSFSSWHRWQEILKLAHLVIVHRPRYRLPQTGVIADLLKQYLQKNQNKLHETLAGYIVLHPVTQLEISATDIRKQIALGKNPRYLLPNNVYQYIQDHGVYGMTQL